MQQPILFSGMVCLLLLSGCLGSVLDENFETIISVELSNDSVAIETIYEQGNLISSSIETIEFDFSESTSDTSIHTFGLTANDGRSVSVDATERATISLDFERHGMYEIKLYALDSNGNNVTTTRTIIVEQIIRWSEEETGSPQSLYFDASPENEGPSPSYFTINSTVTNPSPILEINGRDVDIEWAVINADGTCLGNREIVENGESITWNSLHFTPIETHEVEMTIHEGQDSVNVEHRIELRYTQ